MSLRVESTAVSAANSEPEERDERPLIGLDSAVFRNVQVALRAQLGEVEMSVEDLLSLRAGAVLKLDRGLAEPIELLLNGAAVARGEIVALDDRFAIRITEVAAP